MVTDPKMLLSKENKTVFHRCLLVILVLLGISLGISQEIFTPTLPNLKNKLNASYESVGRLMSIRCTGNIVALLLTAYLCDSFPMHVPFMMAGSCFLGGLATIMIPWCQQFWMVGLLFFIQSGFHLSLNNGGQLIILRTFKDKAIGKMQIYSLGYSIGGFISGFIAQPFLPTHISQKTIITKYCRAKLSMDQAIVSNLVLNATKLDLTSHNSFEYIYLISGLVSVVVSLIFFVFICLKNPMKTKNVKANKDLWWLKISPKYIASGRTFIGLSMIILLFLYYFFYLFGLLNFIPFIVVYAIDPCKEYSMDQKTAAYLHSAVNGCFLAGRIFASFILDLRPTLLILLFNSFNILFVSILLIFSHKYMLALWIGACGMRFCNSIVFPTGTSYANRYIIVTSSLISLAFLGETAGVALGQIAGSYAIDNYPSYFVFYFCLGSMIMLLLSTVIIVCIGMKIGPRNFKEEHVPLMELDNT